MVWEVEPRFDLIVVLLVVLSVTIKQDDTQIIMRLRTKKEQLNSEFKQVKTGRASCGFGQSHSEMT